jgi:hypothetical protein
MASFCWAVVAGPLSRPIHPRGGEELGDTLVGGSVLGIEYAVPNAWDGLECCTNLFSQLGFDCVIIIVNGEDFGLR